MMKFRLGFVLSIFILFYQNVEVNAQKDYLQACTSGKSFEDAGNLNDAETSYTKAIMLKPNSWNPYKYRAVVYFYKKKYNDAIDDINKAISLKPERTDLLYIRACCYAEKKEYDKAIQDFNACVNSENLGSENKYLVYLKRGNVYYRMSKYEEAYSDFNNSVNYSKKNSSTTLDWYYWRGLASYRLKKYSEAIVDLKTYIETSSNASLYAHYYLGVCYAKTGNDEKLKDISIKLIENFPSEEVYFSGRNVSKMFDVESRLSIANKLIKDADELLSEVSNVQSKTLVNIKLNEAYNKLDSAWFFMPKYSSADYETGEQIVDKMISVYAKLKVKPEVREIARKYMVQAKSATESKSYNDAMGLYGKATAVSPCYPLCYYNRALLWELMNNCEYAISNLEDYLRISPDAEDVRAAQDKIYELEGKCKKTYVNVYVTDPIMKSNLDVSASKETGKFIMRIGQSNPKYASSKVPDSPFEQNLTPFYFDTLGIVNEIFDGNIGMQNGFVAEIGGELKFGGLARVQFYYNPMLLSYSLNKINWSEKGSIFEKSSIYTKSYRSLEIAQRYGFSFGFTPKIMLAAYWRPAFGFPSTIEVHSKDAITDSTYYRMTANWSTDGPEFSNTIGATLILNWFMIYYESCFAKTGYNVEIESKGYPKYTIEMKDKIPFRTSRIGIGFRF